MLKEAAVSELDITSPPLYSCHAEIAIGSLVGVLPVLTTTTGDLFALFPTKLGLASATRTFLNFIKAEGAAFIESHIAGLSKKVGNE